MATKKSKKKSVKRAAPKAAKKVAKRSAVKKSAARRPAAASAPRHPVVHWEIQSKMPERLHEFYGEIFSWKIDANNSMNYGMVPSGGGKGSINGGIGGTMGPISDVLVYVSVPDITATLDRIDANGGRTLMPRTDIGPVIMGIFQDPEGNTLGLIEA